MAVPSSEAFQASSIIDVSAMPYGKVIDATTKRAIAGARVRRFTGGIHGETRTKADGSYRLVHHYSMDFTLTAEKEGYISQTQTVKVVIIMLPIPFAQILSPEFNFRLQPKEVVEEILPPAPELVDQVVVTPPVVPVEPEPEPEPKYGKLRITCHDAKSGKAIYGVDIVVTAKYPAPRQKPWTGNTGNTYVVETSPIPLGVYRIDASKDSFFDSKEHFLQRTVDQYPGWESVAMKLKSGIVSPAPPEPEPSPEPTPGLRITVEVYDVTVWTNGPKPIGGAKVEVTGPYDFSWTGYTSSRGIANTPNLVKGSYTVFAEKSGYTGQHKYVSAGRTVAFYLKPGAPALPPAPSPEPTPPTPSPEPEPEPEPTPVKVYLTVGVQGEGTTDPPAAARYAVDKGTTMAVSAYPSSGFAFERWEFDGLTSIENPVSVYMDKSYSLKALFVELPAVIAPGPEPPAPPEVPELPPEEVPPEVPEEVPEVPPEVPEVPEEEIAPTVEVPWTTILGVIGTAIGAVASVVPERPRNKILTILAGLSLGAGTGYIVKKAAEKKA